MPEKSKRIPILTTAYRPFVGGSEIAIEEITRRLPDVFFDIITPRYRAGLKKLECHDNIRIHRVGLGCRLDKFLLPILGFFKTLQLYRRHHFTAVHAYQASYGAGAAWIFKLLFPKIRFLLTLQEGENLEEQAAFVRLSRKLIIKKADVITAISSYLKNYAQKLNPNARIILVPNGVGYDAINMARDERKDHELKRGLNIKEGEKIIITISRLVEKNGVKDLVGSLKELKIMAPNLKFKLLILGDGPLRPDIEKQIIDLELNNDALLLGNVSHNRINEYLAIADVFVRPSLSEGLGNAFLEAMAAGVPIIGTQVGGVPDFLKNGITGLFCLTGDRQDIAGKIKLILTDNELRANVIKNAHELIAADYNWDVIAGKFSKLYAEF